MSLFPTPVGTSDEHRQVSGGTVDSIHREVKQRFFLQISEVLRIRVDVRHLVGLIRGEQYVRLQAMRGEDFAFVLHRDFRTTAAHLTVETAAGIGRNQTNSIHPNFDDALLKQPLLLQSKIQYGHQYILRNNDILNATNRRHAPITGQAQEEQVKHVGNTNNFKVGKRVRNLYL